MAATIASSLEAEQDSGNINKTQSKATPNKPSSQGTDLGGGPRVLDLEKTKTSQRNKIDSLKRRVKKLEKRNRSRTHKLKRLYKVGLTASVESSIDEESLGEDASKQERRIDAIYTDDEITLVNDTDNEMLDEEAVKRLQAEFDEEERLIYMLVEKKYPLTPPTLSMMLEKKLQIDYEIVGGYDCSTPSTVLIGGEEPEPTLEDEFQDLHLKLPVLEVLAHTLIYNALLDKYIESLELGKNRSAFILGEVSTKIKDHGLFTLPCRLGDSKPFDTLAGLGSCVNIIPLYLFKKLNIGLLEKSNHIFRLADETKSYHVGIFKDIEVHIGKLKLLNDFYVIDMKKDSKTPLLVGRGFLATTNTVIDCRIAKIAVGEGITRSVFGVKGVDLGAQIPYYVRRDFLDCYFPKEWEIARDDEINPFKDVFVFRRMVEFLGALPINLKSNMWVSNDLINNPINWNKPPKNRDGAWYAKIRLNDLDGEEYTKTIQSIPTTRKLCEKESPRE
uniref:MAK10-like protein n=1 Tax=Tanacetum cinerariifolium TaxID=118510 RepID=A0A699HWI7_TANCI|nr:hypothetical protein [Tanacetum cinerariifolium]